MTNKQNKSIILDEIDHRVLEEARCAAKNFSSPLDTDYDKYKHFYYENVLPYANKVYVMGQVITKLQNENKELCEACQSAIQQIELLTTELRNSAELLGKATDVIRGLIK